MNYFGMVEFLRLMAMVRPPFVFFSGAAANCLLILTSWQNCA